MKASRIIFNMPKLRDDALESKTTVIITAMTGNTNFPAVTMPTLAVIIASLKAFTDALALAHNRDKLKVVLKNDARKALIANLRILANFVTLNGNQNRAVLISSGFDVTAESSVTKTLDNLQNFSVVNGTNSGEMIVSASSLTGTRLYVCLYNTTALSPNGWQVLYSRTPYFNIPALLVNTVYTFKIDAVSSKDDVANTNTITKMVV